jgi:hypothetical protein
MSRYVKGKEISNDIRYNFLFLFMVFQDFFFFWRLEEFYLGPALLQF